VWDGLSEDPARPAINLRRGMKNLTPLDIFRISLFGEMGDESNGSFLIPGPNNYTFRVIASSEFKWDHVSVTLRNRCPNWPEMCFIKDLFFNEDEICYQLHVTKENHINFHPNCLHLWRPHVLKIPLPPKIMV